MNVEDKPALKKTPRRSRVGSNDDEKFGKKKGLWGKLNIAFPGVYILCVILFITIQAVAGYNFVSSTLGGIVLTTVAGIWIVSLIGCAGSIFKSVKAKYDIIPRIIVVLFVIKLAIFVIGRMK